MLRFAYRIASYGFIALMWTCSDFEWLLEGFSQDGVRLCALPPPSHIILPLDDRSGLGDPLGAVISGRGGSRYAELWKGSDEQSGVSPESQVVQDKIWSCWEVTNATGMLQEWPRISPTASEASRHKGWSWSQAWMA